MGFLLWSRAVLSIRYDNRGFHYALCGTPFKEGCIGKGIPQPQKLLVDAHRRQCLHSLSLLFDKDGDIIAIAARTFTKPRTKGIYSVFAYTFFSLARAPLPAARIADKPDR